MKEVRASCSSKNNMCTPCLIRFPFLSTRAMCFLFQSQPPQFPPSPPEQSVSCSSLNLSSSLLLHQSNLFLVPVSTSPVPSLSTKAICFLFQSQPPQFPPSPPNQSVSCSSLNLSRSAFFFLQIPFFLS